MRHCLIEVASTACEQWSTGNDFINLSTDEAHINYNQSHIKPICNHRSSESNEMKWKKNGIREIHFTISTVRFENRIDSIEFEY